MKALMFGWEFPPHILGGLGTASFGLTRGMAQQPDMDITFVIPKPWGDEDQSFLKIIGANSVPIVWKDNSYDYVKQRMDGRMSPEEYFHLRDGIHYDYRRIGTDDLGCVGFSGRYPDNLIEEIGNYEAVASVLAHALDFDIIHSHDWLTYPAGVFAKHISGKPLVIHVHATDFDRSRGNVNPTVFSIEKRGMEEADHIIIMLFNRFKCLRRVTSRYFRFKNKTRPDMADGCSEKLDWEFITRVLRRGRTKPKREHYKAIAEKYADKTVVLKNQRQLDEFRKGITDGSCFGQQQQVACNTSTGAV